MSPTDPIDRLMEEPAAPWKGKQLNWLLFIQVRIFAPGGRVPKSDANTRDVDPAGREGSGEMQIAPTAFPGPLNDYRFFPATRGGVSDRLGRVHQPRAHHQPRAVGTRE